MVGRLSYLRAVRRRLRGVRRDGGRAVSIPENPHRAEGADEAFGPSGTVHGAIGAGGPDQGFPRSNDCSRAADALGATEVRPGPTPVATLVALPERLPILQTGAGASAFPTAPVPGRTRGDRPERHLPVRGTLERLRALG